MQVWLLSDLTACPPLSKINNTSSLCHVQKYTQRAFLTAFRVKIEICSCFLSFAAYSHCSAAVQFHSPWSFFIDLLRCTCLESSDHCHPYRMLCVVSLIILLVLLQKTLVCGVVANENVAFENHLADKDCSNMKDEDRKWVLGSIHVNSAALYTILLRYRYALATLQSRFLYTLKNKFLI